jgi:thiol-disulfide isomerase/thioredoxin
VEGNQNYEFYKLEADRFRVKTDSLLAVHQGILRSAKKDNASDAFWATEEAELLFNWANQLYMFKDYHPYFAQLTDYKVPEGFMDFLKEIDLNNPAYVKSQQYQNFVSQYIYSEAAEKAKAITQADSTVKPDMEKLKLDAAKEKLTNETALSMFLYNTATEGMQWEDLEKIQPTIDLFKATCKDADLVAKLDKTYNEWKRLEKGQPAFDFSGKDMQGNTVKLSDFKGKYVYVDVWATWCGPCKFEIPYLDTLETDYQGRNVVFISYSIDEDHDAWMKFVPEKKLQGVQIIGEKAWESQLCKDYKIRGVPTFMFFDPEGKIISVKMTRPSDKKTRETFNSLF